MKYDFGIFVQRQGAMFHKCGPVKMDFEDFLKYEMFLMPKEDIFLIGKMMGNTLTISWLVKFLPKIFCKCGGKIECDGYEILIAKSFTKTKEVFQCC
jgi:hypothetical protein